MVGRLRARRIAKAYERAAADGYANDIQSIFWKFDNNTSSGRSYRDCDVIDGEFADMVVVGGSVFRQLRPYRSYTTASIDRPT